MHLNAAFSFAASAVLHVLLAGVFLFWPLYAHYDTTLSVIDGGVVTVQFAEPSADDSEVVEFETLEPYDVDFLMPAEDEPTRKPTEAPPPEWVDPLDVTPQEPAAPPETTELVRVPPSTRPPTRRKPSVTTPPATALEVGAVVDELPRKLSHNAPPAYPMDALRAGVEGRVVIAAYVRSDGTVAEVRIDASSGSASLDSAALRAVRGWRFEPALRAGRPVGLEVLVPVKFSIRQG